ncbi:hypothetical protein MTO96_009738 [Rhipicephalus appendiculatus]
MASLGHYRYRVASGPLGAPPRQDDIHRAHKEHQDKGRRLDKSVPTPQSSPAAERALIGARDAAAPTAPCARSPRDDGPTMAALWGGPLPSAGTGAQNARSRRQPSSNCERRREPSANPACQFRARAHFVGFVLFASLKETVGLVD